MIAHLEVFDAVTHLNHNTRTLMTENGGEGTLRIITRQGKGIGVADACRFYLYHDLACGRVRRHRLRLFRGVCPLQMQPRLDSSWRHSLLLEGRSMPQLGRAATPVSS